MPARRLDRRRWWTNCARSLPTVEHVIIHGNGGTSAAGADAELAAILAGDGAADRRVRARLAAVRSSALDRLFQRHHRPAEADRAWPWRRHPRGAAAERACTTTSAAAIGTNIFGERYHWYSSTGWVMWNCQVAGLLNGTTCCIFDGNPGGTKETRTGRRCGVSPPRRGVTFFGAGAAFFANCMKADVDLAACGDLSRRARARRRPARRCLPKTPALGSTNASPSRKDQWQRGTAETSGGPTSPAAPTSPAPSSAATANCRRRRA